MTYVIRAQREDDPEWYYVRLYGGNAWQLTSIRDFATRWTSENGPKIAIEHYAPPQIKSTAKIEEFGDQL